MFCRCYQLELSEASENRPSYLLHTPTLCSVRRPHGTSSIRSPVLYLAVSPRARATGFRQIKRLLIPTRPMTDILNTPVVPVTLRTGKNSSLWTFSDLLKTSIRLLPSSLRNSLSSCRFLSSQSSYGSPTRPSLSI